MFQDPKLFLKDVIYALDRQSAAAVMIKRCK